jgi:3-deoxy-D-manno-octulosonic-acid transferase
MGMAKLAYRIEEIKMSCYARTMRYLYSSVYYLAVPGLLLRLWWRSVRYNREYRARWQERFGRVTRLQHSKVLWVHAVSMGETLAAAPLVKTLLTRYPDYHIVMTSTTPSGASQVIKHFSGRVTALYTPYDLPDCVNRFLDRVHPDLGIILETELWPNLILACAQRKMPLLLANARLSAKSCRGYRRIKPLAQQMLNSFTQVAAQTAADGQRFLALGLKPEHLQVTGNIKFDLQLPADLMARSQALRASWGTKRPVLIAASTHEGEENILLEAFTNIRKQIPDLLFILVPRHPERFIKVGQLCTQAGFTIASRSRNEPITADTHILLGDTLGEVMLFYAASDVAFVGGSFVPVGGHNLIEPAILSIPVLTGPHLHNFVEVSQLLLNAQGAKVVTDADNLKETVLELLGNSAQRTQMGEKARQSVLANSGALEKHIHWIASQL